MSFCHGCIDVAGQRSLFVKAESLARLLQSCIPSLPLWADVCKLDDPTFVFKGTFAEKRYKKLFLICVNLLLEDVFDGVFDFFALVF